MWTRFIPSFVAAAATAANGEVGRIVHVRTDHGFDGSGSPTRLTDPSLAGELSHQSLDRASLSPPAHKWFGNLHLAWQAVRGMT